MPKPLSSKNITVIGLQWGDEGKGKIVDWVADRADAVIRFQGGHNAGHTLVVEDKVYKLSLLPSGIVQGKISVIGNGVVVDPKALLEEIARIEAQGVLITPENLWISERAPLILPFHGAVDRAKEAAKGNNKIGTTGRGIGPAYEDKVGRRSLRLADLYDPETVDEKLDDLLFHHNALLKGLGADTFTKDEILAFIAEIAPKVLPFAKQTGEMLAKIMDEGGNLLFEGAQAVMLDVDHGTYPFVTSSNTVSSNVGTGAGLGAKAAGFVVGVAKAYTTRVGSGPFPTELFDKTGELIAERGHEFGTVTGRPRRCGWFDAVMMRYAVRTGGADVIALTKLDILDALPQIAIAVAYELDGERLETLPSGMKAQERLKPIYEYHEGWQESTKGITEWDKLPEKARAYLARLQELTGTKIACVSTGPERNEIIFAEDFAEILG
ncbi:adenylosuccinate synthetase [Lasius niger]|uniref:Adenylosuccinate synthetase n=1 Tax=Lasius niger TaxID=67767 RepID=A0A0J7KHU7_LASNI|nr:adenylosuccinate synthetase [Lasius niger]